MGDWDVPEVKGHLAKLYSELDEINAQEKIKLEELAKMTALHTAKLEEERVLSGRLHQIREQRIPRLQSEIHAIRSTPGYAVGNEQPDQRIIEEDRGGAMAICGADAGNGDEDMEDQNQEGNADDEDEDHEDEDYDNEDDEDYDAEDDENEEDEDDEDEEDAKDEDEDDEHGDEDGSEAAEDDEEDDSESWSSGSDDGGGEYPAYDDASGSANSDAYKRRSPLPNYDP